MPGKQNTSAKTATQARASVGNIPNLLMKGVMLMLFGLTVHARALPPGRPEQKVDDLAAKPVFPLAVSDPLFPLEHTSLLSPSEMPIPEDTPSYTIPPLLSFTSGLKNLATSGINPAIVYTHKLEGIGQVDYPDAIAVARGILTEKVGPQYNKTLNAYLSMQPLIARIQKGYLLDADTLLHFAIRANKLFLGKPIEAPEYRIQTTWMPIRGGNKFLGDLNRYFSGQAPWHYKEKGNNKKAQAAFVHRMQEKRGMDPDNTRRFLDAIEMIDISAAPGKRAYSKLDRLLIAIEEGRATSEQNRVIRSMLDMLPSKKLPEKIRQWAEETITAYHACDPADFEQVFRVLAKMYYHFEKIHPFKDGNGRTGMWTANLLLHAWGYPSILLSHLHDSENYNSLYVRKIINDFSEAGLREFFRIRIQDAQLAPIEDETQKKHVLRLMQLTKWLENAPEYKSQELFNLGLAFAKHITPDTTTNQVIEKTAAQITACYNSARKTFMRTQKKQRNNLRSPEKEASNGKVTFEENPSSPSKFGVFFSTAHNTPNKEASEQKLKINFNP